MHANRLAAPEKQNIAQATPPARRSRLWSRTMALPTEHGSWVFLFSPLLSGLLLGQAFHLPGLLLFVAVVSAFLARQPLSISVKVFSGRRSRSDWIPARFWLVFYGALALLAAAGLLALGYGYIFWLALPALPLQAWHLWLVSRRAERRQALLEISGSAVLALSAAAAWWVGRGAYDLTGWLLAGLLGVQAASSIIYAYLRLAQRPLKEVPPLTVRLRMALPALLAVSAALGITLSMAWVGWVAAALPLAFTVQVAEALYGTLRPAIGAKPTAIGVRQLLVSALFTLVFIAVW